MGQRYPLDMDAKQRVPEIMAATRTHPGAQEFVPASRSLRTLAEAARGCRGCDVYRDAEQTMFGAGPRSTNAVEHFKFTRAAGSKRRNHQSPTRTEVVASRPWLFAELEAVTPDAGYDIVATAHPSAVLRGPADRRAAGFADLVADLSTAANLLGSR